VTPGSDRVKEFAMLGLLAAVVVTFATGLAGRNAFPSFDVYAAHYPNILYALNALRDGHGLLWNALQNCGQPFLPSTLLGMFYPLNWPLFFIDLDFGFRLLAVVHMAIGAVGAYLLCRQLGAGRVGALVGGLCFGVGGPMVELAMWQSTNILGIYVWTPWALWRCERILAAPTVGNGVVLGLVLTLQLFGAYPQILLFTCQVIGLRVLWELATGHLTRPLRTFGVLALAVTICVCLGAIQLLPMAEFAHFSVRSGPLENADIRVEKWDWPIFRDHVTRQVTGRGTPIPLLPLGLLVAVVASRQRRMGLFYALVAMLYLALNFDNFLYTAYQALPAGKLFREPNRFIWVSSFAGSIAAGLGVGALVDAPPGKWSRLTAFVAIGIGVAALHMVTLTGLRVWEWQLAGAIGAVAAVSMLPAGARIAATILPVLVLVNLVAVNSTPFLGFLRDSDTVLHAREHQFADLRSRMTLQDRAYAFGKHPDYTLTPKTPQVFGVRSIDDYEPQTSRRLAMLQMVLRSDRLLTLTEYLRGIWHSPANRRVMNLMATRYLLVDLVGGKSVEGIPGLPLTRVWQEGTTVLYENTTAMPRAFYVPMIRIIPDPEEQVRILGSRTHNARRIALVDEAPADGFLGSDSSGTGEATVRADRSEMLDVHVSASKEGFLSLSDQYYPGWEATVNGIPTPIQRGNAAFRVVRVPAGESDVVFHYRPLSVRLGAGISVATFAALLLWYVSRRRRMKTAAEF